MLVRPVWFLFDKADDQHIAAVVLLGNPLVLWPGLGAILVCLHDFIVARRNAAFLILMFYLGCYLPGHWPISAAFVGTSMATFNRLMLFPAQAGFIAAARSQSRLGIDDLSTTNRPDAALRDSSIRQ